MKIPMVPCKYHQKGGFSMAMLVLGRVMGNGLAMPQSSMKLHTLAGDDFLIFGNHHGFRVPNKNLSKPEERSYPCSRS